MEYHCSTLEGGCDFYRILPMMANRSDVWHDEEEEE